VGGRFTIVELVACHADSSLNYNLQALKAGITIEKQKKSGDSNPEGMTLLNLSPLRGSNQIN